ncbi:uncharacterized protein LOC114931033 [Nylanderia fulva]|uniref:uncharacterized protein LOC114931033 n=1 Tax=Nylanderia fulva TaxID=613905 RepID=UPI0010FB741A|nr:uncharacterized protein LOC114931033 [Nylanderia fulva]
MSLVLAGIKDAVITSPSGEHRSDFTLGISMPVLMTKRGSIGFNVGYQLNFALPWNVSQFEPTIISARHVRDLDLQETYVAIENLLDEHGWRDGRQCLLRTICELAETPLRRIQDQDVLEEMIHLILTPTEDSPLAINSSHRSVNKLYQEAERLGSSGGDCILTYPDCVKSPLESFTEIVFP